MVAMNELTVNVQHSILTLAGNGWCNRRIADELGINRETVGKYLVLARSKPAIPISGSDPAPYSKPAISTAGSVAGRQSLCLLYSAQIVAAVAVGLSAQRIYQDLVCEHGFTGNNQAVKRFVRHLRETQRTLPERTGPSPQLEFLDTHPLIRSLDVYEALTPDCFNPQPKSRMWAPCKPR